MKVHSLTILMAAAAVITSCAASRKATQVADGPHTVTIVSTADIYGRWLDSTFVKDQVRPSLLSVRKLASGIPGTVALVDAGNFGGRGNISFYYDRVAAESIEDDLTSYMGYDALMPEPAVFEKDGIVVAVAPWAEAAALAASRGAHVTVGVADGNDFRAGKVDLNGIDLLICHGDNRPMLENRDSVSIVDAGTMCRKVGISKVTVGIRKGKVVTKTTVSKAVNVDASDVDAPMKEHFAQAYAEVGGFSRSVVGDLACDLAVREAYMGQSDYMNLYHSLALSHPGVEVSLCAPLSVDGVVEGGPITYNDIARVYPFENRLVIMKMTGREIVDFLEASYDLQLASADEDGFFRLKEMKDTKSGTVKLNFKNSPGNFESAGGLVYVVDASKPCGSRITVASMADGAPFSMERTYNVGMTSYRATGAGGLLGKAGITKDMLKERTVLEGPEFRSLLYDYLRIDPSVTPERIGDTSVVGSWHYVPEEDCRAAAWVDLKRIFTE